MAYPQLFEQGQGVEGRGKGRAEGARTPRTVTKLPSQVPKPNPHRPALVQAYSKCVCVCVCVCARALASVRLKARKEHMRLKELRNIECVHLQCKNVFSFHVECVNRVVSYRMVFSYLRCKMCSLTM
jgi:hypothetical protein